MRIASKWRWAAFAGVAVLATAIAIPTCEATKVSSPYSVSVRGYYRSDGTYVRPHRRRMPGMAEHDRKQNEKTEWQRVLIGLAWFVVVGAGFFVTLSGVAAEEERCRREQEAARRQEMDARFGGIPSLVEQATSANKCVRFQYVTQKGTRSTRTVRPHAIAERYGTMCLVGHCYLRNAERAFALARIQDVQIVEAPQPA